MCIRDRDYGKTLNRDEVSHRGEKVAILGLGSFYQLGEAVAALSLIHI